VRSGDEGGGGVYNFFSAPGFGSAVIDLRNHSTITKNISGTDGGGVLNADGTILFSGGSTIIGNIPDDCTGCKTASVWDR
jgi:hypothetical protein